MNSELGVEKPARNGTPGSDASHSRLEALHRWAQSQQFNPSFWLRQPDLQTAWYVIRDIAARVRNDRISTRQIWAHVWGEERPPVSTGRYKSGQSTRRHGEGAIERESWSEANSALSRHAEAVQIPFDDEGYLTGVLNRAGAGRSLAILFHGLEGSIEATYMRGVSAELLRHGISALRVNMVNCGGSESCTRRFYHAGFTLPLEISVRWALRNDFDQIVVIGFSLGGNLALKYLGSSNFGRAAEVLGGITISTPIDLAQGVARIDRPRNKFYRYRFLKSMYRTLRRKQELFPDLFPINIEWVTTIAEFDHRYTSRVNGFASGAEYYEKTSSISYLSKIDRPTLILHSQDDLFIPFDAFREFDWSRNPNLIPLFPRHGGHIGFHASARENWMEKKTAEFCAKLMTHRQ
ncbi:MAG TPA: alpha/beta fold hydrolase [Acidobacteriota bacterium]